MIPIIISIVVFTSYVLYAGVDKSISATYYKTGWIFQLSLLIFAVSAIIAASTPLMFLAGSGIVFVAAAPNFRFKSEGDVHFVAAYSGIIIGFIQVLFWGYWQIFLIMLLASLSLKRLANNHTYWIEIVAFYLILLGIILYKL